MKTELSKEKFLFITDFLFKIFLGLGIGLVLGEFASNNQHVKVRINKNDQGIKVKFNTNKQRNGDTYVLYFNDVKIDSSIIINNQWLNFQTK